MPLTDLEGSLFQWYNQVVLLGHSLSDTNWINGVTIEGGEGEEDKHQIEEKQEQEKTQEYKEL